MQLINRRAGSQPATLKTMWRIRGGSIFGTAVVTCLLFQFVCTDVHAESRPRHPRHTEPPVYYLDVLVLTDYAVYKSWYDRTQPTNSNAARKTETLENIKRYFTLVIQEVSAQYGRLQTQDFRLKFRPVGFYIVDTEGAQSWTLRSSNGRVDADRALTSLMNWLQTASLPTSQYDHAMLFTGEDLATDDSGHTTGRATVGTMCKGARHNSVSVIEDRGAFQSVPTAVHELGHSLNAVHDGDSNSCSATDRYIMAPGSGTVTDANRRHPWFFSDCSVSEIRAHVMNSLSDAESKTCFETASPTVDVPDVIGVVPGQLYDQDIQCQHLYGPQSSFCFQGNLSSVCTVMACTDPSVPLKCLERVAATGSCCGKNKWCQVGECVASAEAPECKICRDQSTTINGLTCPQMANTQPYQCYNSEVQERCCESCQKIESGIQGCPYGDKKLGCSSQTCKKIFSNGDILDEDCCDTCKFDRSTWTCSDVVKVDGLRCDEAVQRQGIQGCYNQTLAYYCCATCQRQRDLNRIKDCEYGDLLLSGCTSSTGSNDDCDRQLCCDTCSKVSGSGKPFLHKLPIAISVFISQILMLIILL